MIWVVCGAGRGVGKTVVAQSLVNVLDSSVYCKCGHNAAKNGKPDNYFNSIDELVEFIDGSSNEYEHVIVESNVFVYSSQADISIYIDGIKEKTVFYDDAIKLAAAADVKVCWDSSVRQWKKILGGKLSNSKITEVVCGLLLKQREYLYGAGPSVRSKVWFEAAGDRVFGSGLARLLENVDRVGSLQAAADASNMSYRYAWNLIKTAEMRLGDILLERHAGGVGGGGSKLSMQGRRMLDNFMIINKEVAGFAEEQFRKVFDKGKVNG